MPAVACSRAAGWNSRAKSRTAFAACDHDGDMDAREQLSSDLQRETDTLRRIARGILLEPALAEDAVQEAWLAALRVGPHAVASGGWLNEAVRRISHGLRRRESRQASAIALPHTTNSNRRPRTRRRGSSSCASCSTP